MNTIDTIKNFIPSTWNFNRIIDDRLTGQSLLANGVLDLTQNQWQENGTMDGNPFFQVYAIAYQKELCVSFSDGREFYRIDSPIGTYEISHLCGEDLYTGLWVGNDRCINLQWDVKGKRKDYTMRTTYQRVLP